MASILPKVLIVSIPKAGTNLLMQVILGIPGMVRTSHNMFIKGRATGISAGQMGVMHLPYTPEFEKTLLEHDVKVLFISRDPRDVAVSMLHFILSKFPSHVLRPVFAKSLKSNDARLSAIINGARLQAIVEDTVLANQLLVAHGSDYYPNIREFYSPFLGWIDSPSVCHVTFEELAESPGRSIALERIVDFLWEDPFQAQMSKQELTALMEQNINPGKSPTFRKGQIGGWKTLFNEQHVKDFKHISGQMLIELGYESDLSW